MPKITPRQPDSTVTVKTRTKDKTKPGDWWNSSSKLELTEKLLSTTAFLKEQNQRRYHQASLYAKLYGNMPLFGWLGSNLSRFNTKNQLPSDRPTMSVITSCTDTVVARVTQDRPRPEFITDDGDYKQRTISKQANRFIGGEFYQTKAYELGALALRDGCVWGTGVTKVLKRNKKVALERRLHTQLLVDHNEAFLNDPRQLIEIQLIDRAVLANIFPKDKSKIESAEQAYPDTSGESERTVADQVMTAEAWRLPSHKDADDGLHVIACTSGIILEEPWTKDRFPFAFLHYSKPQVGFWGQGLAERLFGIQNGINQLLMQIHASINLVGVPRVFVEDGSKVVKAHLNNSVGSIVTYRGTKPSYEVAPCVPVELYTQLQNLIQYAYQQEGISQLAAQSQKPQGLTSGEAIRSYDDIQSDRLSLLSKQYQQYYIDLAYLVIDSAREIAEEEGSYQTVFPDKNGTKQIDLPDFEVIQDPFVIQCASVSSLPKDPAGRLQKVTEMMQAALITPQEGRRLLDYPDIEQEDRLASAGEERILKIMDEIVEEGKYTPPDPFMDLTLANQIVVQYYNLYSTTNLEEEKQEMLRNFFSQVLSLKQQAQSAMMPPPGVAPPGSPPGIPGNQPQASPMPMPQNEMLPNVPGAA